MGGRPIILAAVLLASGLGALTSTQADATSTLDVDIHTTHTNVDTYILTVRHTANWNMLANSSFQVKGYYPLNQSVQDAAAFAGIVRGINGGCVASNGIDPCGTAMSIASIRDSSDAAVEVNSPITFTTFRDPNAAEWLDHSVPPGPVG